MDTQTISQSLNNGDKSVIRADLVIQSSENAIVSYGNGSVSQLRSAGEIVLKPGFTVVVGAKFEALIKACNEHE